MSKRVLRKHIYSPGLYLETSARREDKFDQCIAWKAERKSPGSVPPWDEAAGRAVTDSAAAGPGRQR